MNFINWLHSQITCYCRLCQPSLSLQWNVCWRLYIYRLLLKPSFSFIIFSTHVYSVCVIKILLWVHLVAALKQYLHAFTVFDRYIISNTKKNTWDSISSGYPNIKSWKYDVLRSVFDEIRGVWIADETLSRVFDKSSQWKQKLRSKR